MKTNHKHSKGLGSESDQQNTDTFHVDQPQALTSAQRPRIDYAKRQANRQLPLPDLLALLRTEAPRFYELAEVVGNWVWIQFADKQPSEVTSRLAEFGFHWNNKRKLWQHPCGPVTVEASQADPREKYGTCHAADMQPA